MIRSQSYFFRNTITIYFFFCPFLLPNTNTFASPTLSLCRLDQKDALLEFQKLFPIHTIEGQSVATTSWDKSVDCCSWDGVMCDAKSGEVISLKISCLNITVNTSLESSSSLFKLQQLRELDLSDCNLQGEIPSSIGNLSHLTSLDLSGCNFHGEIPSSIGNLSDLTSLDLSRSNLQGEIPSSIGNLSHLTSLDLSGNNLQGKILSSIGNLSYLTSLDLSGCNLQGEIPSSFGNLSHLTSLNLSNCNLQGEIPFSVGNLSDITSLDLSDNGFDGPIPKSISKLRNLKYLYLNQNSLGGRVPTFMSALVNLHALDLSYNKFDGQVPHHLWRSHKLKNSFETSIYMDLSHNSFSTFEELGNGSFLRGLDLSSNSLKGAIPQWICNVGLYFLDLSNNHLTGSIPPCLKNSNFVKLNLRNNSLSGFLPDFCTHGSQLLSLDISRNNLVGKLPKSLIRCKNMEILNVRGNKIKDTFPFWLGSLKGLRVLSLQSNALYGPVYNPVAYLGFPSLRIIDISNNNFVGSLPKDYFANWTEMTVEWQPRQLVNISVQVGEDGTRYTLVRQPMPYRDEESSYMGDSSDAYIAEIMQQNSYSKHGDSIDLVYKGKNQDFDHIYKSLKIIDFSGNRFSGHIPASIGLLSELRQLNLSGNAFTGNIPPSLANIAKLETLDLSRNNLSGTIPQGLGKLSFLSDINFSYNHLEGLVPQSTQFGTQKCSSFAGNLGLYGLEKICEKTHVPPVPAAQQPEESLSEPEEEPVLNWIAAAITFGPGVICGLVIGHIFTSYKHEWFTAR